VHTYQGLKSKAWDTRLSLPTPMLVAAVLAAHGKEKD